VDLTLSHRQLLLRLQHQIQGSEPQQLQAPDFQEQADFQELELLKQHQLPVHSQVLINLENN